MKAALPRSEWEEEGSFYSTVLLKVALLPGKLGAIKKKKKLHKTNSSLPLIGFNRLHLSTVKLKSI